MSKAVFFWFL